MEIHCSAQGAQEILSRDLEWFFRPVGSSVAQPLNFGPGGFVRIDDPRAKYTSVINKFHVTAADEGEYICEEPRGQRGISTLHIRKYIHTKFKCVIIEHIPTPQKFIPKYLLKLGNIAFNN